jgi:polyhydroxyalkanoate synthesis regulator phasin
MSNLQRQQGQLQGKVAQQARDLRQAAEAGKASKQQVTQLTAEVQQLRAQLQGKAAALSR